MIFWVDEFSTYGVQTGANTKLYMEDSVYSHVGRYFDTTSEVTLVDDPDVLADASSVAVRFEPWSGGYSEALFPRVNVPLSIGESNFLGCQFKVYVDQLPADNTKGFAIEARNVSNETIFGFQIRPTGALAYYDDAGTVRFVSPTPLIYNHGWQLVEFTATRTGTALNTLPGEVVLVMKVNNVEIFNDTIVIAALVEDFGMLGFLHRNDTTSVGDTYLKDLIMYDDSGSYNTTFLGPVYIERKTVNSDADFQWAPSSGTTGYTLLDETGPDDTDYIAANATPPLPSYFGLENLPADAVTVKAVMLYGRLRKEDTGSGTVQMSLDSSGTPTNGNNREITTAFRYWWDVLEVNTNTGTAWTPTEFNNATFKINRIS